MHTADSGPVCLALLVCAVDEMGGSNFELPILRFDWPDNDERLVVTVVVNWCHPDECAPAEKQKASGKVEKGVILP